jgi:hypothetical protein
LGEFDERGRDATAGTGINAEFVVTMRKVLHRRLTANDATLLVSRGVLGCAGGDLRRL